MDQEQASTDTTESASTDAAQAAPVRATRSRRATAAVTSPPSAPVAAGTTTTDAAAAPVTSEPARRSRAKKSETTAASAAEAALIDVPSAAATVTDTALPTASPTTAAETVPKKRAASRRASAPVTAPGQGELSLDAAGTAGGSGAESAKAPAKRTRTARAATAKTDNAKSADSAATESDPAETAVAAVDSVDTPAAEVRTQRRSTRKSASSGTSAQTEISLEPSGSASAESPVEPQTETEADTTASKTTRSRRRSAVKSAPTESAADGATPGHTAATDAAATTETTEASTATGPSTADEPARDAVTATASHSPFSAPDAGISALFLAPDLSISVPIATTSGQQETPETADDESRGGDRRGRGRLRNRRARSTESDTVESHEDEDSLAVEDDADATDDGVTSRRRRRRRRGDADLEVAGGSDEDPPNTVTRVRAPRPVTEPSSSASNRVTSLRGSTRLEAKKQRRRDSRDSGRRRTVITEAEFLARRESVDRVMVVRQSDDRIQIGVLEDGILAEHFVSKTQQDSLIGNVYLGKVQNVLPSMEAAFVDIGRGRNAVLYAGEVDWDAANLNGQPRRIENALKSGDSVLVQVSKDPVGHKGARLTSQISLPGRYLVFVPGGSMTGISRKLPDVERNRLKRVLKDHLPENAGVIVRTAAEGASEEELTNDINRLRAQWEGINTRASSNKTLAPEMLYAEPDLTIKVVRDVFNEDFSKLVVSGEDAWDTIEAYVTYVAPDLLDRLEKWSKPEDIFGAHRIDEQISKALERKVFLPSGGSLVIDRTEAMTVVDVNTGKFTGSGGNLEETVTKNNLEAAEEVVRQLRLRDIGGIIVIDFIDMVLESNRDLVLRRMVECLGRDRTKHQVAEVTSLGLVQMTRKRMGTGLLEVFGEQCGTCAGRGMVTHEIPVEHSRVHTVATATADTQSHPVRQESRDTERTANRSTRSERKRNRNRGQHGEPDQYSEADGQHVPEEISEAEKAQKAHEAQKAHAARTALANIAAAAAASHHEHDGELPRPETARVPAVDAVHDAATLTLGGEAIELPRGHRSESSAFSDTATAERDAALAGLAQALDQLAAPGQESRQEGAPDTGTSRSRSRKARRNRSAHSAQGGSDMAVETHQGGSAAQGSAPHSSAAVLTPAAPAQVVQAAGNKNAEPIILGVGVPAAEL